MSGNESSERGVQHRPVRSYVLRPGRMTEGQRQALARHWPDFGLEVADGWLDARQTFGREAPLVLEIGFGMGDSLLQMAGQQEDTDFIGVEVHPPGVGRLLMGCADRNLPNLRVFQHDAVEVLDRCIPEQSLSGVQIYFPDPWPKKKHHKRRLVQAPLVSLITEKLQSGGYLHLATDWQPYAEEMREILRAQSVLRNRAPDDGYAQRPDWRPETKFERRGERLGHGVWDLLFERLPR